jgi:hypothetical protein
MSSGQKYGRSFLHKPILQLTDRRVSSAYPWVRFIDTH